MRFISNSVISTSEKAKQSIKMAQFQLSPCTISDLDAMVDVYLKAFNNTFMNQILFPTHSHSPDPIRTWLYSRFKKHVTRGHPEMKFFKATEIATGRLAALARFGCTIKLTEEEQARRDEEKALDEKEREEAGTSVRFPEGATVEACEWYFGILDLMRENHMKSDQDYS
jgi:hypothetical protein